MTQITPQYTILSLDGGGIRGIIPARVLTYIEDRLKDPETGEGPRIAELFDLMAGTSTGGMLACGLNVKGEDGRPKHHASEMIELYRGATANRIFEKPALSFLSGLFSLARSKFPAANIEAVCREFFGNARLSETYTDMLVTSYNTEAKKPFYFKSSDCRKDPENEDFYLWEIARSTSAAPTFFPPRKVGYQGVIPFLTKNFELKRERSDHLSLVDGGVFANNPSMLAYIEARTILREKGLKITGESQAPVSEEKESTRGMDANVMATDDEVPFLMVSIGTGDPTDPYLYDDVKGWGMVEWVVPLIDILMQGVSETVDYQMRHLLPPYADSTPRYIRLNIPLDPDHSAMDDPSEENTSRLFDYAERIVTNEANKEKLDIICDLLKKRYEQKKSL